MLPGSKCCGNCYFHRGRCMSSPKNPKRGKTMQNQDGQDCAYWIGKGTNVSAEIERYLAWKGGARC